MEHRYKEQEYDRTLEKISKQLEVLSTPKEPLFSSTVQLVAGVIGVLVFLGALISDRLLFQQELNDIKAQCNRHWELQRVIHQNHEDTLGHRQIQEKFEAYQETVDQRLRKIELAIGRLDK